MFTQAELDCLIEAMRTNGVTSFEIETQDEKLRLDLEPAHSHDTKALTPEPVSVRIISAKSPCIGEFAPRADEDGLNPLAAAQMVEAGETLGYIVQRHARALVTAPVAGTLTGKTPQAGEIFGYGDEVFSLEVTS